MDTHSDSDLNQMLKQKVSEVFEEHFGAPPDRYIMAPGRVNLIGEHTDYNDGFVLPCAIRYRTLVAISPRTDKLIRVVAADYNSESDQFELSSELEPHPEQLWSNYVRGVVKFLVEYCKQHYPDTALSGVDIAIAGNVPQGAGLSSSASLEVAIGTTLANTNNLPIGRAGIARIGQQAENDFVGCKCGIMDQMASACGEEGNALMLDCRSLATRLIPIPNDLSIMIINSNVKRGLVDSEYNTRREQCEEAAKWFGVKALRDVTEAEYHAKKEGLNPVAARRALHVITENSRTLAAAEALQQADVTRLSSLMAASHESMKSDFEITVPPIDYIVDIVSEVLGEKGGVRMTGGGFGGCVVALMPHSLVSEVKSVLAQKYSAKTGLEAVVYVTTACGGAGLDN